MTATAGLPLADTSDMIGLHQVFRDALAAASRFVGTVDDGDVERAELVGAYYANVLDLLHGHHESEDELLAPRLRRRMPEHAAAIDRVGEQHRAVLAAVADAQDAVGTWRASPSTVNRARALAALEALKGGLTAHLDEEERDILPIAAQCIDVAEWGELPAHGMKTFRGDKLWLIIGLVQEQMTPDQLAAMELHMPPPLLEFWNGPGRAAFASFIAELRH